MARRIITDLIATKRVEVIDAGLPVHAARTLLDAPALDALLVLTEHGPCGVLRRGMLDACGPTEVGLPAAALMQLVGPAICADMDAVQALRVMQGCGRNDLPVMDQSGAVVSLVSRTDLQRVLDNPPCEDLVA